MRKCYFNYSLLLGLFYSVSILANGDIIVVEPIPHIPGLTVNETSTTTIKFKISYETVKADLDAGRLTKVGNFLKDYELDDETKRTDIEQFLKQRKDEAEKLFEQYLSLKVKLDGDKEYLQQAETLLLRAEAIWTDNYSFKQEHHDLSAISSSGGYEKWKAINDAETEVNKLIENAKTCNADNDCVRVGFGCPFGCDTAINKSSLEDIKTKIVEYNKLQKNICMYDCYVPADLKPKCIENQCKLK